MERVGLGLLGGCTIALPVMLLLWWNGSRPALWTVAVGPAVGTALGLLRAVTHQPTLLDAAVEADRQLHLCDLLGTAWLLRHAMPAGSDEQWSRSIVALADDRCRHRSSSTIRLSRFGMRAWMGIALAPALVLVVALLGDTLSDHSSANAAHTVASANPSPSPLDTGERMLLAPSNDRLSAPSERGNDDIDARSAPTVPQDEKAGSLTPPDGAIADASDHSATGEPDGGANGAGRTDASPAVAPAAPTVPPSEAVSALDIHRSARAGVGDGQAGISIHQQGSDDAATGITAGLPVARHLTPPWQTDHWPADVDLARGALQSGAIPAAYRDVVRHYFERE